MSDSNPLADLRMRIDAIDYELIQLLARRFAVTEQVGLAKRDLQLPPTDPAREEEMFSRLEKQAIDNGVEPRVIIGIYQTILEYVKDEHRKIAGQV